MKQTIKPTPRIPGVGISIFAIMAQKASAAGALNMAQGFPDFTPPQVLQNSLKKHLDAGLHQYAPMPGLPRLREAIAIKTQYCNGIQVDPDTEVTLTVGATEALFTAITSMVHRGDEVIVFDPAYDSYAPTIRLAGGIPVHLGLSPPNYRPDWQQLKTAITSKTRLIILNTPHNPCGSVLNMGDWEQLARLVDGTQIALISDEVYEHMVFDDLQHVSMLRHPELRPRAMVMSSFGKTYHATGWKLGYCIAPAAMTAQLRLVHQFTTFCVNTPTQHAIADHLNDTQHYDELPDFYVQKRNHFQQVVKSSRFELLPCQGSYFQLLKYDAINDMPDTEFCDWLIAEHGIAAIPVSVFYADKTDHKVLRFCFAKDNATLDQAGDILCKI